MFQFHVSFSLIYMNAPLLGVFWYCCCSDGLICLRHSWGFWTKVRKKTMKCDSGVSWPEGNKSPSLMHDCFLSYICGGGGWSRGLFVEPGWGCFFFFFFWCCHMQVFCSRRNISTTFTVERKRTRNHSITSINQVVLKYWNFKKWLPFM